MEKERDCGEGVIETELHYGKAAAVQHLMQVQCRERDLSYTLGYYGIQPTVWLVAKEKN